MVEKNSVGVFDMFLELIENISHDKSVMAYVLTSLEAIISENQRNFKLFMRALQPKIVDKLKSLLFLDGYEPVVYEAAAKIATMVLAEEGKDEAKEWVILIVGGLSQKDANQNRLKISDQMIMPICVYLLKHESLAKEFLRAGGMKM